MENYAALIAALPDDERVSVEERAAIIEYDGNLTRLQAEMLAWREHKRAAIKLGQDWVTRVTNADGPEL